MISPVTGKLVALAVKRFHCPKPRRLPRIPRLGATGLRRRTKPGEHRTLQPPGVLVVLVDRQGRVERVQRQVVFLLVERPLSQLHAAAIFKLRGMLRAARAVPVGV